MAAQQITADSALFTFYDIESLQDVFTLASYNPRKNELEVYYLIDEGTKLHQDLLAHGDSIDILAAYEAIIQGNPALPDRPLITFYDLRHEANNIALAQHYGLSDAFSMNNPKAPSTFGDDLRIVCDTDPDYDPFTRDDFLVGYNSYNYDTTMLSIYFNYAFSHKADESGHTPFTPPRAEDIRAHNDDLFTAEYIKYMPRYLTDGPLALGERWDSTVNKIRSNMISSGRHFDAARLNEKQQRVALKRLLGMLGYQIMESDRLGSHNARLNSLKDLYELLAYNVSDVVGLSNLFRDPTYSNAFDLKRGLLEEYPEVVYDEDRRGSYTVRISPDNVRRGRLTPDSSSAKFVGLILSPYGKLNDIPTVSFNYPSKMVCEAEGVEQFNVLELARTFFYEHISDDEARRRFDEVYMYYASIQGKNFNDSEEHINANPQLSTHYLKDIVKTDNNLPYFTADGTASTCFATFSVGGIHGAEAHVEIYEHDLEEYENKLRMLASAHEHFPRATDLVIEAKRQHNLLTLPDGSTVDKTKVLNGSDPTKVSWRRPKKDDDEQNEQLARAQMQIEEPAELLATQRDKSHELDVVLEDGSTIDAKVVLANRTQKSAAYKEVDDFTKPVLFEKKTDGSTKLRGKYTFTSIDQTIHEDFSSYYPNMLRNMSAFFNERLGQDRYTKIFHDKERYGKLMKDPSISKEEKNRYKILREGTKLILNTASGAGDATHKTPIRMNNMIISMRLIGQVFSWMIGQAQTLHGARIVSTNTDGLYSVLDEKTNNRILEKYAGPIRVLIEPEPLMLVSKDSNNRLELEVPKDGENPWETEIISASGGTLACHAGPRPDKALAHPAVTDLGLADYLQKISGGYVPEGAGKALSINSPMNRSITMAMLEELRDSTDMRHAALMFQNMVSASTGAITYPFATDAPDPQKAAANAEEQRVLRDQRIEEARAASAARMDEAIAASDLQAAREIALEFEQTLDEIRSTYENDRFIVSEELVNPTALQHYNRVFIVKPGTVGAVNLRNAGAWKITPAVAARRARENESSRSIDELAREILRSNGLVVSHKEARETGATQLPVDQDIAYQRINSIDPRWSMLVINQDLTSLGDDGLRSLLDSLDLEVYLSMIAETFEKNWMNRKPV